MLNFGVGCLNLGIREDYKNNLSPIEFKEILKKDLGKIKSINNLEIKESTSKTYLNKNNKHPNFEEDFIFHPNFFNQEISFTIFIPKRIQDELLVDEIPDAQNIELEIFNVFIINEIDIPVCFVSYKIDDESEYFDASTALLIVKKYLELEFHKLKLDITLEVLDPLPLHIDFVLKENTREYKEKGDFFKHTHLYSTAYDEITIYYNKSIFKNIDLAFSDLKYSLSEEINIYYSINKLKHEIESRWNFIIDLLDQCEYCIDKNPFSLIKKNNLIRKSFKQTTLFKITKSIKTHDLHSDYIEHIKAFPNGILNSTIKENFESLSEYPIDDIIEILRLYESRKNKSLELIIITTAAIMGGITGSVLTKLL